MSSCEKCWRDAGGDSTRYHALLAERVCSAEEQAGPDARECPQCGGKTIHQHTGEAMCGCMAGYASLIEGHKRMPVNSAGTSK